MQCTVLGFHSITQYLVLVGHSYFMLQTVNSNAFRNCACFDTILARWPHHRRLQLGNCKGDYFFAKRVTKQLRSLFSEGKCWSRGSCTEDLLALTVRVQCSAVLACIVHTAVPNEDSQYYPQPLLEVKPPVFSPEFTGQRAQIISWM